MLLMLRYCIADEDKSTDMGESVIASEKSWDPERWEKFENDAPLSAKRVTFKKHLHTALHSKVVLQSSFPNSTAQLR